MKPDYLQISAKIKEILKDSKWDSILRPFMNTREFDDIFKKLIEQVDLGFRFTPPLKTVFKAFEVCPYDKVRMVIVSDQPSMFITQSDGLALSCSVTKKPDLKLTQVFNAINLTVYDGKREEMDPDLSRWANQGILLLNVSLTSRIDKSGKHYEIWRSFMNFFIEQLNFYRPEVSWIFIGKEANKYEYLVKKQAFKLSCPDIVTGGIRQWEHQNVFNKINEHEILQKREEIVW